MLDGKKTASYISMIAAQGYVLAQRNPSEMQPNIILVSPLLTQNTEVSSPAKFQILDGCLLFLFK